MYCKIPFTTLEIAELFDYFTIHTCCPGWSPLLFKGDIKELPTLDLLALWHSETANVIRAGVRDGSYSSCLSWCPNKHRYQKFGKAENIKQLNPYPEKLLISFDKRCNLACYHCRQEAPLKVKDNKIQPEIFDFINNQIISLLSQIKILSFAARGEALFAPSYLYLLELINSKRNDLSHLELHIVTNGQNFDLNMIQRFPILSQITYLSISVDATREQTYRKIRGGNWHKLVNNLIFAGDFSRRIGADFNISMVVQQANFREIPDFISLAKKIGATRVSFQPLSRAVGWGEEEWMTNNVLNPNHPEFENCFEILSEIKEPSLIIINHAGIMANVLKHNTKPNVY